MQRMAHVRQMPSWNTSVLGCPIINPLDLTSWNLVKKTYSGAGISNQIWTYSWDDLADGLSTNEQGPAQSHVKVTNPDNTSIKYTFSNVFDATEGDLLEEDVLNASGVIQSSYKNQYAPPGAGPWATPLGDTAAPSGNSQRAETLRPVSSRVLDVGGDTYTWLAETFDGFGKPLKVKRSNTILGQSAIEEQTTYLNDPALWVLGLPLQVTNVTTGETELTNTYNSSNDTLLSRARFGQTLMNYTFDSAGQLASFTDGDNHTTSLSNYKRGIPQSISYPDGTRESLAVDDFGQITAITDQAGHSTSYSYDPVGRLTQIAYPTGDEQAWYAKTFAYAFVPSAERGIAANHWRRTITTGNDSEVTYFDAMLRPLLSDSSIVGVAGSDITSAKGYDWRGLTTFASTPVSGAPDLSGIISGVHETYDALGRLTQSQQDSELGTLTTSTAYLSGNGMQVTDPKGNVTTTRYQVFDQPGYNAVTSVQVPAGVTQTIARDLYGNPTAITQSGLYNGTETDSVTKTLTYDSYHRLCRTTEPESGSAVMAYDGANNLAWSASGVSVTGTGCGQDQVTTAAQTTYTYDPMNQVLTIAPPSGTQSTQYTYDALGQMTRATSGITDWNGTYNFRGMLTGESLSVVGQTPLALGYAHDAYGSLSLIHYPDGENVSYAPDARGRPTQVGSYASQVSTFPNGAIASFKYGNGAGYVASQNTRQLLSNFSYGTGSTLNLSEDFVYDPDGNITNVNDLAGGPRSKTFGYDGLNRLTNAQATGLWGVESYTYDPLNNLRTRLSAGQTFTYNYDATNKLTSLTNGASTVGSYQYDNRGNVISKNGVTLLFDQKNQLSQIAGSDSYAYDAFGRRVTKTPVSGGAATYYFYNHGGQLLYQYAPGSAQTTNFIYLGTRLVARNVNLRLAAPGSIGFDANPNNGSYTVSWGAVPAATSYTVQESANGGALTTVATVSGTSTALSGRVGGSYVYRVQGCSGATCGGWTTSATLGVTPTLPTMSVPSGATTGSYTVSWTAPAGATAYTVQERFNGGVWNTLASNTTATSISRPGTTGGSYTYQVSASNAYGTRGWAASGAVQVTTIVGNIDGLVTTDAAGDVSISGWACSTGIAQSISVDLYLGGPAGSGVFISRTSANQTSEPGVASACQVSTGSYRFAIPLAMTTRSQYVGKAIYVHGISPAGGPNLLIGGSGNFSVPAVPTAPAAPASLSAGLSADLSTITLSWPAANTATSYVVQQQFNGGTWTQVASGSGTAATISQPADGSYLYRVQACSGVGCSGWTSSNTVTVLHAPTAAPGVTVPASSSNGSYTVSWSGVAGPVSYTLQEQVNGGGWATVQTNGMTSWSTGGRGDGTYGYRAQACNTTGCGPWSTTANTTVLLPPPTPTGVTAPATSNGPIAVTWNVSSTATSYDMYESFNSGSWIRVNSVASNSATIVATATGSYQFFVTANNSSGWSGQVGSSNVVTVTIPPASAPSLSVPGSSNNGSYTISWGGVSGATSYTLQEQINGGGWSTVQANGAGSWSTSGRGNGTYGYRVQACNVGGCGPWSATANTTVLLPPPTPASISVPATSNGPIAISWAASATATIYGLDQSVNGGAWAQVYANSTTSTTVTVGASGSYSYRAYACNASGCNGYATSGVVSVTIPPASAPGLNVPASSNTGGYTISWGGVSGATSYTLQEQLNGGGWGTVQANGAGSWSTSGRGNGSYGYRVQACNVGGCGPWSGVGAVTVALPPTAPASVTAPSYVHGTAYYVSWTAAATATSYNVRVTNLDFGTSHIAATTSGTSALMPAPKSSHDLQYAVQACNGSGCSAFKDATYTTYTDPPGPVR